VDAAVSVSAVVRARDEVAGIGALLAALEDERIACAFGERLAPDLGPPEGPLLQGREHAERHPFYGYSNAAGAFRRSLWERRPFDEALGAGEDAHRSALRARLDPWRGAMVAGKWVALR
jgi:hypothetical protein